MTTCKSKSPPRQTEHRRGQTVGPGGRVHRRVGPVLVLAHVLDLPPAAVPLHSEVLHTQVLVGGTRVQLKREGCGGDRDTREVIS